MILERVEAVVGRSRSETLDEDELAAVGGRPAVGEAESLEQMDEAAVVREGLKV